MATISITPKAARKPLKVNYGDDKFVIPTRIPLELITARDSVPRPKVLAGSQKTTYQEEVSVAILAAFVEHVLPIEFRNVLDLEDVPRVFEAWAEESGWGKSSSSANSGGATKGRSSTNSDEEDSD